MNDEWQTPDDLYQTIDRFIKLQIPEGHYCYEVLEPIYKMSKDGTKFVYGHKIRYCPYWYGFRPDGGCMIFGKDPALGDACKACGWREPDTDIF